MLKNLYSLSYIILNYTGCISYFGMYLITYVLLNSVLFCTFLKPFPFPPYSSIFIKAIVVKQMICMVMRAYNIFVLKFFILFLNENYKRTSNARGSPQKPFMHLAHYFPFPPISINNLIVWLYIVCVRGHGYFMCQYFSSLLNTFLHSPNEYVVLFETWFYVSTLQEFMV